jgi:uncharacterized NAD(P)/FAD-binding protein YdhS
VSRRGLLPQSHRRPNTHVPLPVPPEVKDAPPTALGVLRAVRRAVRRVEAEGHDWRDVISSLRPVTVELWASLDTRERARFLRHVRPFWDTHRHRIPSDVAEEIDALRRDGTLVLHRGRIASAEVKADGSGVRVRLAVRNGGSGDVRQVDVRWVVNCTGPDADVRRVDEPLWSRLLERGIARADALGMGVVTTPEGALIGSSGQASPCLFLVGPLRKAQLWESTAVPELRVQASNLARTLLAGLPAGATGAAERLRRAAAFAESGPENAGEDEDFVPVYVGEHI